MRIAAAAIAMSAIAAGTGAVASGDMDAVLGKALFDRAWVPAPSSTDAANGLGPLFSARSCSACHAGPALAARFTDAPDGKVAAGGFVVRFGSADGRADPAYGRQLQNQAVQGMPSEGRIVLTGTATGNLDHAVELVRGPLDAATRQSARLAPSLLGRAALERIDPAAVLALADPEDRDGDGISGRAHMIKSRAGPRLGRFGWKASITAIDQQIAAAFAMDMGLASALRPLPAGDCTPQQADCLAGPHGTSERYQGQEISDEMLTLVAAFVESFDVPKRPGNAIGARLFADTGCAACHVPGLPDRNGGEVLAYTDLLLHDMGPSLDDGVGEADAASAEWRTAPLVAVSVGEGRRYLHDGRAPTIDAAIRAHGGEAEAARARYDALSEAERSALVAFVESL